MGINNITAQQSSNCVYSWTPQISGSTSLLYSVKAVNENICWTAGSNSTVLKTINGGITWLNANPNPGVLIGNISNIEAIDENNAWVTTSQSINTFILSQDKLKEVNQAEEYFKEARVISEKDDGNLWGMKLYGPMLFVNPKNRMIIANQPDKAGLLEQNGNIYIGELPKDENIANTAFNWSGYRWTMIIWPLPENKFMRANLMMHELFHRIQDTLGFPAQSATNNHLDKKEGRILFQLELEALKQALITTGEQKIMEVKNALLFRKFRRNIYQGSYVSETVLELNEGLAEYTGVKLSGRDETEIIEFLKQKISDAKYLPSFVRSFAYITGPIYGILLDQANFDWRKTLSKNDDLADLLAKNYNIEIPKDLEETVISLSDVYNGDEIRKLEDERERNQLKILESYRKKFVEDQILIIPLKKMNVQFDPRNLLPLDSIGTVYPNIRISDNWGILTVSNGALMSSDWTKITISAQDIISTNKNIIECSDWKLELNEGWELDPSGLKGNLILVQNKK